MTTDRRRPLRRRLRPGRRPRWWPSLRPGSRARPSTRQVYVVHGIPGVPVDVYAGGRAALLPDFQPGTAAGPRDRARGSPPGPGVRRRGRSPRRAADRADTPVIDQTLPVPGGANVSVVANLDGGTPNLQAFANDLSAVAEGSSRVTVRHAADAPAVDVLVNGAGRPSPPRPGRRGLRRPARRHLRRPGAAHRRHPAAGPLPRLPPTSRPAKNVHRLRHRARARPTPTYPLGLAQQVLDAAAASAGARHGRGSRPRRPATRRRRRHPAGSPAEPADLPSGTSGAGAAPLRRARPSRRAYRRRSARPTSRPISSWPGTRGRRRPAASVYVPPGPSAAESTSR